ncbi:MAG: hypothetical protein HYV26_17695 [Candidatus Hydrogenedentes bacterium]|nr:hypothetical protein [Candidatus Hydrogenedentota bacterium]
MDGRLVLISPYDPAAAFNVGHAMQRNKLIYALADAALVVSSDYGKGGTWTGAVEQLDKLSFVPVYVRSGVETGSGLEALCQKGALVWPDPDTSERFTEVLAHRVYSENDAPKQSEISFVAREEPPIATEDRPRAEFEPCKQNKQEHATPAEELFAKVHELITQMSTPKTDAEVAAVLRVSRGQAKEWLTRLVEEGVLQKLRSPTRYFVAREVSGTPRD